MEGGGGGIDSKGALTFHNTIGEDGRKREERGQVAVQESRWYS